MAKHRARGALRWEWPALALLALAGLVLAGVLVAAARSGDTGTVAGGQLRPTGAGGRRQLVHAGPRRPHPRPAAGRLPAAGGDRGGRPAAAKRAGDVERRPVDRRRQLVGRERRISQPGSGAGARCGDGAGNQPDLHGDRPGHRGPAEEGTAPAGSGWPGWSARSGPAGGA
jgi:hypothetical protein